MEEIAFVIGLLGSVIFMVSLPFNKGLKLTEIAFRISVILMLSGIGAKIFR